MIRAWSPPVKKTPVADASCSRKRARASASSRPALPLSSSGGVRPARDLARRVGADLADQRLAALLGLGARPRHHQHARGGAARPGDEARERRGWPLAPAHDHEPPLGRRARGERRGHGAEHERKSGGADRDHASGPPPIRFGDAPASCKRARAGAYSARSS